MEYYLHERPRYMTSRQAVQNYIKTLLLNAAEVIEILGWDDGYEPKPKKDGQPDVRQELGDFRVTAYEAAWKLEKINTNEVRRAVAEKDVYNRRLPEAAFCAILNTVAEFTYAEKRRPRERRILLQQWNRSETKEKDVVDVIRKAAKRGDLAEIYCQVIEEAEQAGEI